MACPGPGALGGSQGSQLFLALPLRPLSCQALMRELELKEKKIKEIQSTGDRLPGKTTLPGPQWRWEGACMDLSRRPWGEG